MWSDVEQASNSENEVDITEHSMPPRMRAVTRPSLVIGGRRPLPGLTHRSRQYFYVSSSTPSSAIISEASKRNHLLKRISNRSEFWIITAGTIVAFQVQLVSSVSMTKLVSTRALLFFSIVLELLSILLAIFHHLCHDSYEGRRPNKPLSRLSTAVAKAPILLVMTGILVMVAAMVTGTFQFSTSIGIVMVLTIVLVFGVNLYLLGSSIKWQRVE